MSMGLRHSLLATLPVLVGSLSFGACTAEISGDQRSSNGTGTHESPSSPGTSSPASTPVAVGDRAFALPANEVTLLPFKVRLAKVATVAGVPITDPILQGLRDARYSLGDYDFANSQKPDSTWTALRISDWVRAIKPVCASSQVKARFASLPADLPALISAAHGRTATAAEKAAVDENLLGLTLSDSERYEAVCLSVLSSLEFLAQ